jgi:hypothetical protein
MKLSDLIAEARQRCSDTSQPPMCTDARFTLLANDAENEACRRARLLVDSTTPEICKIDVLANQPLYPQNPSIIFVRRASLDTGDRYLSRITRRDLDDHLGPNWMTETGEVVGFVPDTDSQALRLFRIPEDPGVLSLTVVRLPKTPMVLGDADVGPEIHPRLHMSLVSWMVYRFFDTPDAEMRDPKKAAAALVEFEREFGPPATATEEQWATEHYAQQQAGDDGIVYGA